VRPKKTFLLARYSVIQHMCGVCCDDTSALSGTVWNGMPYRQFVLLHSIYRHFLRDKYHTGMPNGQCGHCMQTPGRSLVLNRVRDDDAHYKTVSQSREARFTAENPLKSMVAGLCPDPLGSLQCSPDTLAGFRGEGPPERCWEGEREADGMQGKGKGRQGNKGMEGKGREQRGKGGRT